MERLSSTAWIMAAFIAGMVFVYSCGGENGGGGGTADGAPTDGDFATLQLRITALEITINGGISDENIKIDANINQLKIGDLDTSKIITGIFSPARIPDLDTSKITTGTFPASRINNIPTHPSFPDDLSGSVVNTVIQFGSGYTVSPGKTLYILTVNLNNRTDLTINGVTYFNIPDKYQLLSPIIVPENSRVSVSDALNTSGRITGVEVISTITPVNVIISFSSPFIVPTGKTFYILSVLTKGSAPDLFINGVVYYKITDTIITLPTPIIAPENSIVSVGSITNYGAALTGYLK